MPSIYNSSRGISKFKKGAICQLRAVFHWTVNAVDRLRR